MLTMAAAIVFGWGLEGCGTDENCNCPDGNAACDIVENQDTNLQDLAPDNGEDSYPEDMETPDEAVVPDSDAGLTDVSLGGTATIRGRVTFTNMTDHGGIIIRLSDDMNPAWTGASTVTTTGGDYEFTTVPEGKYRIKATYEGFTVEKSRTALDVEVADGAVVVIPDMTLTATGIIRGRAVFGESATGPGGNDAGIMVYLPGREHISVTRADGSYEFAGLLPGKYRVCAALTNYAGSCLDWVAVTGLKVSDPSVITIWPEFSLEVPWNRISGRATMVGQEDNAGISVTAIESGMVRGTSTTDTEGNWNMEDLIAGMYTFVYSAPDGSGFEQGAWFDGYEIFYGVTEMIPPQYLSRGRAVADLPANDIIMPILSPDNRYLVGITAFGVLKSLDLQDSGLWRPLAANAGRLQVSPDSTFVAFGDRDNRNMLYSVPIDGSGDARLLTTVMTDSYSQNFMVTPDSSRVVFNEKGVTPTNSMVTIHSADPVSGSTWTLCQSDSWSSLHMTPDGRTIVCHYSKGSTVTIASIADGTVLYTQTDARGFSALPGGTFVVTVDTLGGMKLVDLADGTATDLDGTATGSVIASDTTVFFNTEGSKIMATPISGGPATELAEGTMSFLALTPDKTRLAGFKNNPTLDNSNAIDLYSLETTGGELTLIAEGISGLYSNYPYPVFCVTPIRTQNMGWRIADDSTSIYVLPRCDSYSLEECDMLRIMLDGSGTEVLMSITSFGMGGREDPWTVWEVNDARGFAMGTIIVDQGTLAKSLIIHHIADGSNHTIDHAMAGGISAPDRSSFISWFDDPYVLTWYDPATLERRALTPYRPEGTTNVNGPIDFHFSDDSTKINYNALFGRSMTGYLPGARQRHYIVDLD